MSAKIKIVSINVELNKHIDRVTAFLHEEKPDVVCLQEVSEYDVSYFKTLLGMEGHYEPMVRIASSRPYRTLGSGAVGLALFCRFPASFSAQYYVGSKESIPVESEDNQSINGVLVTATCMVDGNEYVIGTTHFTWTPDGEASDAQRRNIESLFSALGTSPHLVFCGDFNAPRGKEIWGKITQRYRDNIPTQYTSSIDPVLHRATGLKFVVDGLFSTPAYSVTDVRLVEGISDHKAIVGFIEKRG
ncbi:MAG: hypothetical protein COV91_05180 [Candidatus Taylorbacteria bacterium CG11_big_fil_rev_8_21_14_0_20_46_11]|uniref:Endonuclease/exonuclease/phosphatase domain-containing protein n=1 Tax=Candidatus Taylorbacteria bacterium CG11_big_fil_rev_8_21_14_0_20_46_11 TaxID=1975025 RepID=A0A2H0KAH8_9BACT|nr:MAG: hypothetical protein COV91_05180 [Candidatus Taylorbacteria bacterium CG11_big_fil_rev_8_21_14_0_20_46_11]